MSEQSVTLRLPDPLFQRLKRKAERAQRSVEDELLDVVASAVPAGDELPPALAEAVAQLAVLDDQALWQAARTRMPVDAAEHLEELHFKQQREGLNAAESEEASALGQHYERVMLVRAQAAALLKQRGHDVSVLLAPV